jgi:hypothetical protein
MRAVFSMDNTKVYGEIAYQLSFKKAADEYGAICRYKIIISVITSKYYNRKDLRDADVLLGYSDVNAENIAKQIALKDAVKKNAIKKIITFHPTISHSENFVGEKEISIKHRLKDFDLYNVSSKKNMGIRRNTMRAFRNADNGLVSNARCLNEGVDVPAIDMVAFMSPKKSKVSIVQAVGRAIRKPRGSDKKWGYVFVPIFLEKASSETNIEAAERSNFKDIYEVINALRDHDEVLNELITNLRIQKGSKGKINGKILDDYIQINGVDFSIKELENSIRTEIVDRMSSNWYETFGKLKKYRKLNPEKWPSKDIGSEEEIMLGRWVQSQRNHKRQGTLNLEYEELLNTIDFPWTAVVFQLWEQNYNYLLEFRKKYPDRWPKPNEEYPEGNKLGSWFKNQRRLVSILERSLDEIKEYSKDKIDRAKLLLKIDVPSDQYEYNWEINYNNLKQYWADNPSIWPKIRNNKKKLNTWSNTQRERLKKNKLSDRKIKLLKKIKFPFYPNEEIWIIQLNHLKEYFELNQKYPNIREEYPKGNELGGWTQKQLGYIKNKTMKPDRLKKFKRLGIPTTKKELFWFSRYNYLIEYRKENPNSWPSYRFIYNKDIKLGLWCNLQRKAIRNSELEDNKLKMLKKIEFMESFTYYGDK